MQKKNIKDKKEEIYSVAIVSTSQHYSHDNVISIASRGRYTLMQILLADFTLPPISCLFRIPVSFLLLLWLTFT